SVGLPRESKISRAWTDSIRLMVSSALLSLEIIFVCEPVYRTFNPRESKPRRVSAPLCVMILLQGYAYPHQLALPPPSYNASPSAGPSSTHRPHQLALPPSSYNGQLTRVA